MIDLHAHIFFDELLGRAGKHGPVFREIGPGRNEVVTGNYAWPVGEMTSLALSAEDRLVALDRGGIDIQVLSLSPLWLFHSSSAAIAQPFLAYANDLLHDWVGVDRHRLRACAALPAEDVPAALASAYRGGSGSMSSVHAGAVLTPPSCPPDLAGTRHKVNER